MILRKGKHNFWSQLLLSMIAILALPNTSGLAQKADLPNHNYQNAPSVQQVFLRVALVQQVQQQRLDIIKPVAENFPILIHIVPHVVMWCIHAIPPIRAGPNLFSL